MEGEKIGARRPPRLLASSAIAEFFLFSTFFHEQFEKTRARLRQIPQKVASEVEIKYFAKLEISAVVTSRETVVGLKPFHIWQREAVRERFEYEERRGIHLALVRGFRLIPPWRFPDKPAYRGCRSRVKLPQGPEQLAFESVLPDDEQNRRKEAVQKACGLPALLGLPDTGVLRSA